MTFLETRWSPASQDLAGAGVGAGAHTAACHSQRRVKRRRRRGFRLIGVSGRAHEGGNPTGVRRRLAGVAGHTNPGLGLGRTTVAACRGGPVGSVRSRDQAGRLGI